MTKQGIRTSRALPSKKKPKPSVRSSLKKTTVRKFIKAVNVGLQKSEKAFNMDFRLFVKHIPAAVAVFDRGMKYLLVSDRWMEDYGLKNRNIIGRSHYEVFPEIPERWKKIHRRCLAGAVEKSDEDFFIRPNGDVTWNRWEIHPWHDGKGDIGGIIMFTEVYTEYKLIEQKLIESEERFRSIFREAPVGIVTTSLEGRFLQVNPAFCKFLGYRQEELQSMAVVDVTHPEDIPETKRQIQKYQPNQPYLAELEKRYVRKDGAVVWARLKVTVLKANKAKACFVAIVEDITEQKLMLMAIEESRQRYELATNAGLIGVWDARPDTGDIFVDPVIKTMLGYKVEEIKDRREEWEKLFHPDDLEKSNQILESHLNGEIPQYEAELRLRHKNGDYVWVLARGTALRDKAGRPYRIVGTTININERMRVKLLLQGSNTFLEQVATSVPLEDVLLALVRHLEEMQPQMRCSILLLDQEGKHLFHYIAPSLPKDYNTGIDGLEIGPGAGSCGTAAYTAERTIVSDVMNHPYWIEFREQARKADIRACWSEPIISSTYRVLGTFAMYYRDVREPKQEDVELIQTAAR